MNRDGRTAPTLLACLVAGSLALSGCTGDAASVDKAGGAGPLVLRMANVYSGLDYEPGIRAFVDSVDAVSDGAMTVDVVSEWNDFAPDAEKQTVADVAAGEADLGWTGTRAFDLLDVSAFAPLTAPMLIDSYALQDAVIESELPALMLESLDDVGVDGLAVLGGGLRKPIAATAPLVAASDWNGVTFQTFPSDGHAEAIRALDATPTDVLWDLLDVGVIDGDIRGFEKNLLIVRINGQHLMAPYVTTNVNLWPETSVVFANPARMAQLTEQQRGWLREAADVAAAESSELYDDQAELETLCAGGARAAEASAAQLDELRAAFAPVIDALRAGEAGAAIDRIEELKAATPAEPPLAIPAGCTGAAPRQARSAPSDDDGEKLDGLYRWELTAEDAMAHGTADDKTAEAQASFPWVMTMKLEQGTWTMGRDNSSETSSGTFTIDDGRITFDWPEERTTLVWSYVVDAAGTLTLAPVDVDDEGDRFVWSTKPWQRIG